MYPIERKLPDLAVMCGIPALGRGTARTLEDAGFRLDPVARTKVIIDYPRGYALRTAERLAAADVRLVVVTWNTCPEHLEDLWDLRPAALLNGEALMARDLAEVLPELVARIDAGDPYRLTPGPVTGLTRRQRDVVRCVARGWSNKRIGRELCIGEQAVKNLLRSVYQALGLRSHAEIMLYYWEIWQSSD